MLISDRINALLAEHRIKPAELSKKTDITPATISRILNNVQVPTAENLHKIARYFNVSMDYIFTGEEENCESAILSKEYEPVINLYRSLKDSDKEEILMLMEYKIARYDK